MKMDVPLEKNGGDSKKNFKVHNPKNGRTNTNETTGIISYTDGSVLKERTGCGVHTVHGKRVIYNGNFFLGSKITVFQQRISVGPASASVTKMFLQNSSLRPEKILF